jgi:hypothetical protein
VLLDTYCWDRFLFHAPCVYVTGCMFPRSACDHAYPPGHAELLHHHWPPGPSAFQCMKSDPNAAGAGGAGDFRGVGRAVPVLLLGACKQQQPLQHERLQGVPPAPGSPDLLLHSVGRLPGASVLWCQAQHAAAGPWGCAALPGTWSLFCVVCGQLRRLLVNMLGPACVHQRHSAGLSWPCCVVWQRQGASPKRQQPLHYLLGTRQGIAVCPAVVSMHTRAGATQVRTVC